jgi:hypothetical protein
MKIYEGNTYYSTNIYDMFHKWNCSFCISQKWVFSVRLELEKLTVSFVLVIITCKYELVCIRQMVIFAVGYGVFVINCDTFALLKSFLRPTCILTMAIV